MNNKIKIQDFENQFDNDRYSFLIGLDENQEVFKTNFRETLSILIGGNSSCEIDNFIETLIYQFERKDIDLHVIDIKKQFSLKKTNFLLTNIINERFDNLELWDKTLKPVVIIVNEWVDLLLENKSLYKLFEEIICRGKAFGVYLIATTTNFNTEILKSILTKNILTKISFKVDTKEESKMILNQDMGGSENLLGTGDMLFLPLGIKRIQAFRN